VRPAQRLVGALWRWHRRIGLVAAIFVLVLSVTGIALNHPTGLALDQSYVQNAWLLRIYGDDSSIQQGYHLEAGWVSQSSGGQVYLNAEEVAVCYGDLVGAMQTSEFLLVGCADQLVLLLPGGELVESMAASAGLPVPLEALGRNAQQVVVKRDGRWFVADLEALRFDEPLSGGSVQQIAPGTLPAAVVTNLPAHNQWLTWERVVLDLHSGRVFGRFGVILMDAAALLLMCLASSGVLMWLLHRRRRQRR